MVQYDLYSVNGDDIKEKQDRGEIAPGILLEPVEAAKYDHIRLPVQDILGIVIQRDSSIAKWGFISLEEVRKLPLILPHRDIAQEQIASWLGVETSQLHIFAVHNLLTNATLLAEAGLSCLCTGCLYHSGNEKCLFRSHRAGTCDRPCAGVEKEPYLYDGDISFHRTYQAYSSGIAAYPK